MKTSYRSFAVFFILISISVLFVSCSQESAITSPNDSNVTPMAKTVATTASSINHSTDTIITFPKSGKTLVVSKSAPASQLALLDTYLQTHTISDKSTITMSPMAGYYTVTISYWEMQNQYKQVPGKYLGIWTNLLSYYTAYNKYGFTNTHLFGMTDMATAHAAGFKYDSMMVDIAPADFRTTIDYCNSNGRYIGYYYINEPVERNAWGWNQITVAANYTATYNYNYPTKILVSSYKWPSQPYELATNTTYGAVYGSIINSASNLYIYCDNYFGNCFGHTYEYWNEYKGYYGASKNIANAFHACINNGTWGSGDICGYQPTSWQTLLTTANGLGLNLVWLYNLDAGDETAVNNCCSSAWNAGWLTRYGKHLVIVYQCGGLDCNWGISGTWTVKTAYYDAEQWFSN